MAQPFVGEIRMFGGNFVPVGWHFCDGSLLAISENETLFQLIGTTYGGDGQNTFALPDLRGRLPLHMGTASSGTTYQIGENGGAETVTLTTLQIPSHTHALMGSKNNGSQPGPSNNVLASSTLMQLYAVENADAPMAASSVSFVGGSQPHTNLQPFLCVSFIISLFGIFPSQG
ncbi:MULTISPECIES: phage tail protein [Bradyrhizobium]|uniref:phage tail protein n=1 Tax=Bradyrhizobium TaxID=374 RepID=UPI000571E9C7|nr:tail fiber protein [Bradyrhizobium elkanii]WLA83486.1 tail fiber protein [Bradyrhizobium elkanii]